MNKGEQTCDSKYTTILFYIEYKNSNISVDYFLERKKTNYSEIKSKGYITKKITRKYR